MNGLTEQERDDLGWSVERDWQHRDDPKRDWDHLFAAVERIVAERERAAQVRALREAADDWGRDSPVTRWLRDRADQLEAADVIEVWHI